MSKVNIIDFEASSLNHNSYPIQVGIVLDNGDGYMSYIKPTIEHWTDWNEVSQSIHNIPRELLFDVGKEPKIVATEMNEFIGDNRIYCDGGLYDCNWCNELYTVSGVNRTWLFGALEEFDIHLHAGSMWREYKEYYASKLNIKQHDALDDARLIQHIVKLGRNHLLERPPLI